MKLYELLTVSDDIATIILTDDMGNDTIVTAMYDEGYICGLEHKATGKDIGNHTAISEAEVDSVTSEDNHLVVCIAYNLTPEDEEENPLDYNGPDTCESLGLNSKDFF